jgi:phage shock protein A
MLIDRTALLAELRRVFNVPTSEVLVGVLDKVAAQVKAAGVAREDFSELKQIVKDLAEAQRRTEQRVEELAEAQRRTEQRVEELAEAQRRTEQRVEELAEAQRRTEQRVEELAEAQRRTEQRVEELAEAQRQSEARLSRVEERLGAVETRLDDLTVSHRRLTNKVSRLDGRVLEMTYREKAYAYSGPILRKVRVVPLSTLEDTLEARLTSDELHDLLPLDLLLTGRPRLRPESAEVWLAVEVSAVVDEGDVARARRRALLLQRAGYRAIPAVAGEALTEGADAQVQLDKVAVLQDGRYFLWEEALAVWLPEPPPAS